MERYKELIDAYLAGIRLPEHPARLYDPVRYVLAPGGKRVRPSLTLMAAEAYGKHADEALPAAAALEIFHNFTLLHDDLMDHAGLRRGRPTVHKKWDENTAVLSGDAMVYVAQQQLEIYPAETYKTLQSLFNRTALEICEGQQEDMDFETRNDVPWDEYREMIRKKTAVLLGAAMQFGAIIAGRDGNEQKLLYDAGVHLGLAFQIADDYLDTFGDESFGKQIGGDIREGKKTFLYIKTLEAMNHREREAFKRLYGQAEKTNETLREITRIMEAHDIPETARQAIAGHTRRYEELIRRSAMPPDFQKAFIRLGEKLSERTK